MQIKTTKAFCKELQKQLPKGYHAIQREYTYNEYRMYIDCLNDPAPDYNSRTGKFSAIVIYYPDSYYAAPRTLTTRELIRFYQRESDRTWSGFWNAVRNAIEI